MKLILHADAEAVGITNPAACLMRRVSVAPSDFSDELAEISAEVTASDSIVARPEVKAFRTLFEALGYPDQIPAGERLIEGIKRRGMKSFNNVVDAYNIVSARSGCGLGLHDAREASDVEVSRATGTETILPIFKSTPVSVAPRDLIYTTNGRVMAWLGKRDVDSDNFKVSNSSTSLLLVALGNSVTSKEFNRSLCLDVVHLLRRSCPEMEFEFLEAVRP